MTMVDANEIHLDEDYELQDESVHRDYLYVFPDGHSITELEQRMLLRRRIVDVKSMLLNAPRYWDDTK